MGFIDYKKKVELIKKLRKKNNIPKEDRRAAYEALRQLEKENKNKVREYTVHATIPSEDTGQLYTVKIDKFMAASSAEAVRYVGKKYGFPSYDPLDYAEENTKEFYDIDDFGIMKVRAETDGDNIFNEEDMLRCIELIFKSYIREIVKNKGSIYDYNNSKEVLELVIKKFKLPKNNRLTEIYGKNE